MNPQKGGGKASYAATSSSSPKEKSVTPPHSGHSSGGSGFGNSPKADQLIRDVAGLSIDTPQDDGCWAVFSKKNNNRGDETSAPKHTGTRIDEELRETVCDREIVWPPMVMVRNTLLDKDDNDKDDNEKWIGMGNQKLPDYFSGYNAVKAPHSYGPRGLLDYFSGYNAVEARHSFHRGISLLIFENSALGYVEAERLHKHFADQGTDRDAWDHRKVLFPPDGTRHQFYGYMANKEDLDIFNQHCQGDMKVKFEMRSHHEMVVIPMNGDNQSLFWLYSRVVKKEKDAKALQEYYGKAAEKLCETLEENRIVRQRTKMQHEQNKEEFFKDQINHIHQASEVERAFEVYQRKERAFAELLQEERKKMQQSIVDSNANVELRQEEISKFIQTQAKGIEEFEAERENLIQILEGEKAEIKHKYLEEEVEVEKKVDTALHCPN